MKNLFNYDYYVGDCIYDFETDNNRKREEKKDQRQRHRKQRCHHNFRLPSLQQQQQKQYNESLTRITTNNNISYRDFHSTTEKRINEIKNGRAAHNTKDYCNDDTIVNHLTTLRRPAQKRKKKKNINEKSVTQTLTPTTILLPSIKSPYYYDDYQTKRKTNSSYRNHTHKEEEEEVHYQNIHKLKQPFTKKSSFENGIVSLNSYLNHHTQKHHNSTHIKKKNHHRVLPLPLPSHHKSSSSLSSRTQNFRNTTTANRKNIIHTIDSKSIVKKLESLTLSTCDNNSNKSSPYHNNQQQFQSKYIVSKPKDNTFLSPKIIKCTYCHFKVLQFIGKSWILPRTNYIFFRQYYPDTTKLSLYLSEEKDDCIAYCCQCTWMNFSSRFSENENCTNPTRMASSSVNILQNVVSQKQKLHFIQRKSESSNRQQNNDESSSSNKKETIGGVAHSYSRLTWVVDDE